MCTSKVQCGRDTKSVSVFPVPPVIRRGKVSVYSTSLSPVNRPNKSGCNSITVSRNVVRKGFCHRKVSGTPVHSTP